MQPIGPSFREKPNKKCDLIFLSRMTMLGSKFDTPIKTKGGEKYENEGGCCLSSEIMRAFTVPSVNCFSPPGLLIQPSITKHSAVSSNPTNFISLPPLHRPVVLRCSDTDSAASPDSFTGFDDRDDEDGDDYYSFVDKEESVGGEDRVFIQVKKLGKNSRRIRSKIGINARLEAVWRLLTDYERLADFIPGLAVSKLIEKKNKFARLYQMGQQDLAFGLKFNAKAVLDCYERDVEISAYGRRRDIDFEMTEGDFQFFVGKWSIEEFNRPQPGDFDASPGQEFETTLSYMVDVKPKMWLPVHLIEGRICSEIKTNLTSIREEAQKQRVTQNTLSTQ